MNKLILYKKVKIMRRIAFLCVVFLSFCTTMVFAQQGISVSGTVTDLGEPLPFVTVTVKGTTIGILTDLDGKFQLNVPNANAVLQFSYIGYNTIEMPVGSQRVFNVALSEDIQALSEVVVTALATQKRVNVTGAITAVTGSEIVAAPVANISTALVGITPGLSAITQGGEPGFNAASISIRGISSFSLGSGVSSGSAQAGNVTPLIVIDGIEQPSSVGMQMMNSLDPNDILGISILKDASSTAVYGIRAANGVVMISTKRGQVGRPQVSFTGYFGFSNATNLQQQLPSYDWALMRNEAIQNEMTGFGNTALSNYLFDDDDLWKFKNNRDFTSAEVDAMTHLTPAQRESLKNSPALYYGYSNSFAEMFGRSAPQWRGNVNISGGTERVRYFVSLGYIDEQSIFHKEKYYGLSTGSSMQRYNFRSNIDVEIFKNTTLSINTTASLEQYTGPGTGTSLYDRYGGIMIVLHELNSLFTNQMIDGKLISGIEAPTNSIQQKLNLKIDGFPGNYWLNRLLNREYTSSYQTRLDNAFRLVHKMPYLLQGLEMQANLRFQDNYTRVIQTQTRVPSYTVRRSQTDPNILEFFGGNITTDSFDAEPSSSARGTSRDIYVDASLRYGGSFDKHSVNAILMFKGTKLFIPSGGSYNVPGGSVSMPFNLTYDYDTRYMAEVSMAYNGTEQFAKDKRYGFFPAVSGGWVASNESFFPKNDILTFLKFRASYGIVGDDNLGGRRFLFVPGTWSRNTAQLETTNNMNGYQFGTSTGAPNSLYNGASEGTLGNPDVTWAKESKFGVAVEMRFFNDRLSVVADYFDHNRTDQLLPLSIIPITFGLTTSSTAPLNIGETNNKGYELVVGWNERRGDFRYGISANVSYAINKIVYMAEAMNPYEWMNQTGHSIGQRFGYKSDGLYNTLEELNSRTYFAPLNNMVTLGDIKYLDLNGDGVVDTKDMAPVGYPNRPRYQFGGSITASYKGFDVRASFSGTAEGSYRLTRTLSPFFQRHGNAWQWAYDGRWTPEKAASGADIYYPRSVFNADQNHYNFGPITDYWMLPTDHLRLKNLEVGYQFPRNSGFLRYAGMSSLRVYVNANNVFTLFDKMKRYGIDPETQDALGLISYAFPLARTVIFGFNIQF